MTIRDKALRPLWRNRFDVVPREHARWVSLPLLEAYLRNPTAALWLSSTRRAGGSEKALQL
jgi:hypothetical protein